MWSFNPIKKKVEDKDLVGKIQVKVGISNKSTKAKELSEELGIAIIEYIQKKILKMLLFIKESFMAMREINQLLKYLFQTLVQLCLVIWT